MATLSRSERAALCDLFVQLGPDAPTLCEGWATRGLAAHLATRERRPDAAAGVVLKVLAAHTASVHGGFAAKPYDELVELVRTGPPSWSPMRLPKVEGLVNTAEFFIHHEDVRRAQDGWAPRELSGTVEDALWGVVVWRSRVVFRGTGCGVVLQRSDATTSVTARSGSPVAVVTGLPQELLLYAFGRRTHAKVAITGPPEARAALETLSLRA
jgi:uncharacterized protein (TIGR03085 family)